MGITHRECQQSMLKQLKKVPACERPQGPLPFPCPQVSAFDQAPLLSLRTSFRDGHCLSVCLQNHNQYLTIYRNFQKVYIIGTKVYEFQNYLQIDAKLNRNFIDSMCPIDDLTP